MQSFGTRSGIVASVTGDGTIVPTIGNQGWFEYGGRLGFRISKGWVADLFLNGTAGPQPVGNTLHGGWGCGSVIRWNVGRAKRRVPTQTRDMIARSFALTSGL